MLRPKKDSAYSSKKTLASQVQIRLRGGSRAFSICLEPSNPELLGGRVFHAIKPLKSFIEFFPGSSDLINSTKIGIRPLRILFTLSESFHNITLTIRKAHIPVLLGGGS